MVEPVALRLYVVVHTINTQRNTERPIRLRQQPNRIPLTIGVSRCHNFFTGRTSVSSRRFAGVHQVVGISGVSKRRGSVPRD